jgi:hypothetical protein
MSARGRSSIPATIMQYYLYLNKLIFPLFNVIRVGDYKLIEGFPGAQVCWNNVEEEPDYDRAKSCWSAADDYLQLFNIKGKWLMICG